MKTYWWKILGVFILCYVFIAGMIVPLNPGISGVSPGSLRTGQEAVLEITGYNSMYTQSPEVRAWLKMDDERALGAQAVKVLDDRRLEATFAIPSYLPVDRKVQDFTLVVDHEKDGTSVLPSAVFVTQDSVAPELGAAAFPNTPIEGLNERWTFTFPFRNILYETIRNTYFHVALWFAMIFIFIGALTFSIRYLRQSDLRQDCNAQAFTKVGILFGILGLATGAIWAKHTWGAYWSGDVKQNMTVIALLIYLAYFILRAVFDDPDKRARISAVYNIFAFAALIPLIYVVPRLTDSLHPGAGGNPALGGEDLDNTMRLVFYPAIIGWTLIGLWMASLLARLEKVRLKWFDVL
ncbi:cytochrome c biogenesis protein CcsA [Phaeodactylibacter sp.]|uniref:cytochrome c biogenesis protein CcsA n=1 Tax=Phaeodactylibacter sp. TaxID=1940289 RepID=UPI0025E29AF1|nr:cytochrome c biogenesis protein CcsA [Phaeodactylibacter sp.]MCI4646978.1 cytochrome c biogenesis protein [Phaeodactylibacter sp.]MCI5089502.1 cytochrome c biogenesis protein [Phaeodactylibacter sp.]